MSAVEEAKRIDAMRDKREANRLVREKRLAYENKLRAQGWKPLRVTDPRPGWPDTYLGFSAKATSYKFALELFGYEARMEDTGRNKKNPECWAYGMGYATVESLTMLYDQLTRPGERSYSFKELAVAAHENLGTFKAIDALLRIKAEVPDDLFKIIRRYVTEVRKAKVAAAWKKTVSALYLLRTPYRVTVVRADTPTKARDLAAEQTKSDAWHQPDCSASLLKYEGRDGVILEALGDLDKPS